VNSPFRPPPALARATSGNVSSGHDPSGIARVACMLTFGDCPDFAHRTNLSVTNTSWPQPSSRRPAGRAPSSTTSEIAAGLSSSTRHSCSTIPRSAALSRSFPKRPS